MAKNFPSQLLSNIVKVHGKVGEEWLASLNERVDHFAKIWGLTQLNALSPLTYHYVLSAHKKDYAQPVVLKLGVPNPELSREISALRQYHGKGAPLLIEHDAKQGALLMDAVVPGTTLKSYFPLHEAATLPIVAKVIQQLHLVKMPDSTDFVTIQQWHRSLMLAKASTFIPEDILAQAQQLSEQLIATQTKTVLLHGDLHHDNILVGKNNTWLAIDPKGIIGDPTYEVGAFIRNPIPQLLQQSDAKAIMRQRIAGLASILKFDPDRVIQWAFVQAVLAACWSIEENDKASADYFMRCAKFLKHG
ncbi:aminoglycoside phosphotransferase family protein [Candidatus Berkiella aquae]|uniref:Aminoglycoside phosphotransferase family protein n=1 Tax=Candidatus Berkiella aquae TaxID=295108 RepID=A0A0Q9YR99_9GAMM|nr:aminoglycoside phosphotransferase family protein [Candidatus Berkiella aquae]MCS5709848.1 aminoglycoside phosphotransferase family protein [Candidatus Berkiella aquae]